MAGALASSSINADGAAVPPEMLASEAALRRPSSLSSDLSRMLADPLWQRGLHPKQIGPMKEPPLRRVEYCQSRDLSPCNSRTRPPSVLGRSCSRSSSRKSSCENTSAASAQCSSSATCSRSNSRRSVGHVRSAGSCSRSSSRKSLDGRHPYTELGAVIPKGSSPQLARICRPPRPESNNTTHPGRPPLPRAAADACSVVSNDSRRSPVQDHCQSHASCGDDVSTTAAMASCEPDCGSNLSNPIRARPRSASSGLILSVPRPKSRARAASDDIIASGSCPVIARVRCRQRPLGKCNEDDCRVLTIKALE